MRALVYTKPFHFEYSQYPDPDVGMDDVLIKVMAVGICGSDVHGYTGRTGRRIPPVIMGHEASGIVEAMGKNARGIKRGDRVCFDSTIYCNQCDACRREVHNQCARREVLGVSIPGMKRHGAMAEFVRIPWWTVHKMPSSLSFIQASLLESVSIAVHAVNQGQDMRQKTVLIIGAGTIGLFIIQAARLKGAYKIIVSDVKESRLSLAKALGADLTVNPTAMDLAAVLHEETGGIGVDISFEVVGYAETLHQAVAATRMGGRVICVGNLTKTVEIDIPELISKELTLLGSYASSGEYSECIETVASGRIDVIPLVSEIRPLSEGQEAFDRLYQAEGELLKIILEP